jgi:hypothetical protein
MSVKGRLSIAEDHTIARRGFLFGNTPGSLKILLRLGLGAVMLFAVSGRPLAQVSEIDSYDRAVTSQTKGDVLAFIKEFGSSHLIGDLIESLRPEVAHEVCADLPSGASRARRACEQFRKVVAREAAANSKHVAAGVAQSSAAAAPTQPIETQPIGGIEPVPATVGTVAVNPQVVAPAGGGQSETGGPPRTAAGSTPRVGTAAVDSAPLSSNLPQPTATPPTMPVVYVRSNSDADIYAQATDLSAIIGTASRNAPLTVLGRDRNWLKVVVPGMIERAGWVHISRLLMEAGAVVPGTATAAAP